MQLPLKCPLMRSKRWLQAGGPQKCTGLIFYKSDLACIKSHLNFLLLMARNEWAGQHKQNHAVYICACVLISEFIFPHQLSPKFLQQTCSINKLLGCQIKQVEDTRMRSRAGRRGRRSGKETAKAAEASVWFNYRWCKCKVSIKMSAWWRNQLNYTLARRTVGFKVSFKTSSDLIAPSSEQS